MAKNKTSYNIDVNLLARAQADFKNIESALAGLGTKAKGIVFDDKSSKKMESTIERITQAIPDLQAKLASGLFSDREIKEFSAGVKSLTKDVDSLSNQFRTIDLKKLGFDDGPLKSANDAIKNIKTSMTQLQSGLRLDTSGILGNQEFVKKLSGAIFSASKSGDSLVNKLADIRTEYQQVADEQDNQAKQFQQKIVDTSGLETQLEVYKRLKQELEQSKKKSVNQYSPELTAALDEAKKIDDTYKGVRSHQDKIEATTRRIAEIEIQLTKEKEEQGKQIDNAAKLQKKAQDAAQRVADIDTFAAKNTTQFAQFDAQMSQLSKDLGLNEQQAESLRTALMNAAQVVFAELITEIQGLGTATKITNEQINENADQQNREATETERATESFKSKIAQIFGLYNVYQLIRRGIQNAYNSIKQLDQAMNEIAVVTNMTTNELWGQIETYMSVARQYGVATQGVYEVSKLYYQQGRSSVEVTKLTAETLKMAKIAGLDYSKATDYMTVALNGFKLAAEDASMVVDVYSKLAAVSATDTEELAYAMSKTASIAESAGMSFQNTTVFLAQMIETTREAPENIGTAMKTIIARFQEMKKSPLELVEVEGEEISFNRVDKALQSIGMTLQDASGQFRNLDDVIYELAGRWDGLDRNTQRYIATVVAGSRQQSRFLALMQDSERLTELQTEAQNSQDAGLIQYYKTLDSVESKLNQLKTAFQQFYMSIINGPLVKGVIDVFTKIITFFNRMDPKQAILIIMTSVVLLRKALSALGPVLIGQFKKASVQTKKQIASDANFYTQSWFKAIRQVQAARKTAEAGGDIGKQSKIKAPVEGAQAGGGMLGMLGAGLSYITLAISAISLISGIISQFVPEAKSAAQRIEEYQEQLERSRAKAATSRAEYQDLASLAKKWNELSGSVEKNTTRREEWLDVNRKITEQYPNLITTIDDESNALINSNDELERQLELKRQIALEDAKKALKDYDARFKDPDVAYSTVLEDKEYELKPGTEKRMIDYRSALLDYKELIKDESEDFRQWAEKQMFSPGYYPPLDESSRPGTQGDWKKIQAALNRVNWEYWNDLDWNFSVENENFAGSAMHAVTAGALRAEKAGKTSRDDINWSQFNEGLAEIFLSSFINNEVDKEVLKYIELEGQTASSLKWDNMTPTQQRALVDYYTSGKFQSSPTYNDKEKTNINTLMEGIGLVFRSINTSSSREELLSNVLNLETYSQLQDPRLTTMGKGLLQSTQQSRLSQALQSQGVPVGEEDTDVAIQAVVTQNESFIEFLADRANSDLVTRLTQFQSDPMSFNNRELNSLVQDYDSAAEAAELDPEIKTSLFGAQEGDNYPQKIQDLNAKRWELIDQINKSHGGVLISAYESTFVSWEALNKIKETQDAISKLSPPGAADSRLEDSADLVKMGQETASLIEELYAEDGWSDTEKLILQSLEFTSYGQLQEAILFVKKSQPEDKKENWLAILENQAAQYKVTNIELDGMFESADKSVKNLLEMVGKTYSPAEILQLVKDGMLKESDIDATTGKIKDPKQFLTDQFEPIKEGLKQSIERAELEGDEISKAFYTNLLTNLQNSIDNFEVASPYEALTQELLKSINFKEGAVIFDEASLKSYQSLGGEFANDFAVQADGTYKLVGKSIVDFYTNLIELLKNNGIDATWLEAIQQSLEQAGKEGELEDAADARKQASDALKNFNQADGTFTIDTETFNRLTSGKSDLAKLFDLTGVDEYQYSGTFTDKGDFEEFYKKLYPTETNTAGFQESLDKAWNEYLESLAKDNQKKIDDAIKTISSSGVITYDESVLGELADKTGWQQIGETVWQKTFDSWDEVVAHINEVYKGENRRVIGYQLGKARKEWLDAQSTIRTNAAKALVESVNFEELTIEISKELFDKLSEGNKSLFEKTGLGTYKLSGPGSFMDGAKAILSQFGEDSESLAELQDLQAQVDDFRTQVAEGIISLAQKMMSNAGDILSQASRGSFQDADIASGFARLMGGEAKALASGGYGITRGGEDVVDLRGEVQKVYDDHKVNVYKLTKYTRDAYDNMAQIEKLEKDLNLSQIENVNEQIAKQAQLARAIADTVFNSESYNFMSNSTTNRKLDPMYTLVDNLEQAFKGLEAQGEKDGVMGVRDLNSMLDYIGRGKQGFEHLEDMGRNLSPPMEMTLEPDDIEALRNAVAEKGKQEVDRYNDEVRSYNEFLKTAETSINTGNLQFTSQLEYLGTSYTDVKQLMSHLESTADPAQFERAMAIAAKAYQLDPNKDMARAIQIGLEQSELAVNADDKAAMESLTKALGLTSEGLGTMSDALKTQHIGITNFTTQLDSLSSAISNKAAEIAGIVIKAPTTSPASPTDSSPKYDPKKPHRISAAQGGPIAKSGKTLVGEFGPEIVFGSGKYNIVGQGGPELVNLPKGSYVFNNAETERVLRRGARDLGTPTGESRDSTSSTATVSDVDLSGLTQLEVTVDLQNNVKPPPSSGGGGKDKNNTAEFDRWYNYLQLIADVERAVSELQQARENLYGVDYTRSLAREIQLLQSQAEVVGKFKQAQETYLQSFENTKIKEYSDYLQVIDGVLQIQWDKLNGMDNETAEPIKEVITEWESLVDSISNSTQEVENFQAAIKQLQDEMRDTYIDVEKQVIDGIKYQQQMVIDNLQKQLDMKIKYDNKYLESLRKNIDKERKMRERSDQEEDRAKLQRKLAMLKRDTSGKSALAISQAEEELRSMNRSAYDQRQDDFVQQEEDALLAAQEALQEELEIQTEVMTYMSENIQLIQQQVDAIMASGPENLATFLSNWNQEYLNSTPTNQTKMSEEFSDLAGKVQGYLLDLKNQLIEAQAPTNLGLSAETNLDPESTGTPVTPTTPAKNKYWGIYSGGKIIRRGFRTKERAEAAVAKAIYNAEQLMTFQNHKENNDTYKKALADLRMYEVATVKEYAKGGLIDYTGPALVHGSKGNPEMVLNAKQTGMFQNFVALMDKSFGKNIQSNMVRPNSFEGAPEQTTVIVENITIEAGVIANDYSADRAGSRIKDQILDIAKYKGKMSLRR